MASAGGRPPSQSRAIPTRTVALSDATQLPPDYCTTPGGTLFSTTPGGKRGPRGGAVLHTPPTPNPPVLEKKGEKKPKIGGHPRVTRAPGPSCPPRERGTPPTAVPTAWDPPHGA